MEEEPSIFTRIIRGEIPCHKIYEDEQVIAFLDISPLSKGHTLVVPKKQIDVLWDLPADDYQHLLKQAQVVARRLQTILPCLRVALMVEGMEVPHAHLHLIPLYKGMKLREAKASPTDHQKLAKLAEKLKF